VIETKGTPTGRRFLVIPLSEDADLTEVIAQHPEAWLLDSDTGVMTSLRGWTKRPGKPAA
jgi:hypothetical protein